uniref:Uncharacterized protein n=1 Tax=Pseudomonas putida (strain ATCC 700007 / DSM 6899 / JCM 31910 / BCRC 17059 / LMG 24140 / F1) TaxID=351746 RepID=A5VZ16_PSEP1
MLRVCHEWLTGLCEPMSRGVVPVVAGLGAKRPVLAAENLKDMSFYRA